MKRYIFLIGFFATIAFCGQAIALEKFPTRPISMISPWEPEGQAWEVRAWQKQVEKSLGQPIVLEYKTGGGATIGFTAGAAAPPDGYTVTMVGPSLLITAYTIPQPEQRDYKRFDPLMMTIEMPAMIIVKSDAPWKSVKEFLDYTKTNPGKFRLGNSGHAAIYHIGAVGVEVAAGVKFAHVPCKGGTAAVMAVAGGHIDGEVGSYSLAAQLIQTGKLRVLAVASDKRYYALPDVPTFKESGVDCEFSTWYGFAVPKGTPRERIMILHDAVKKAIDTPEYKKIVDAMGAASRYLGPDDFGRFIERQDMQWRKYIEFGGFKASK